MTNKCPHCRNNHLNWPNQIHHTAQYILDLTVTLAVYAHGTLTTLLTNRNRTTTQCEEPATSAPTNHLSTTSSTTSESTIPTNTATDLNAGRTAK